MSFALSLTQSQAQTALRSVLLAALPSGIEVVQGQDNLVPEPLSPNFVVMTSILRTRLGTNTDLYQDIKFTGSISGTVLTVASVDFGTLQTAYIPMLFGPAVLTGTTVTGQSSGVPGGAGVYTVSQAQSVANGILAAGLIGIRQPVQLTVQLDVHGPASGDNVDIVQTIMRSGYACDLFAASGYDVTPLFTGEPHQAAFQNAEQQIENMWTCDVQLQVNSIVFAPQQFFDVATITIEPPVDAYPD